MAESKIRDDNYYQVSGWMLNRLGLKGTALQVYAIIYGFTQDGESEFKGSLQYLMDFTNTSKHTVIKALKELTDKGYTLKTESLVNGVKVCTYQADLEVAERLRRGGAEIEPVVQKLHRGSAETAPGGSAETAPGGSAKTAPNNKSLDNKDLDNKKDKKKDPPVADYSQTNFSVEMRTKVDEWLLYKTERGDTYQPTGLKSLVTQIQNKVNDHGERAVIDLIGECMASGYQGIIFDRLKKTSGTPARGRKEPVPRWMKDKDQQQAFDNRLKKDMDALKKFTDGQPPELSPEYRARVAALKRDLQGPQ